MSGIVDSVSENLGTGDENSKRDPRFMPEQPLNTSSGPPRVAIKLSDQARRSGQPIRSIVHDLLEKVVQGAGQDVQIDRLINSEEEQKIADLVERAKSLDPSYEPVDFTAWIQARLVPRLLRGPGDIDFDLG